MFKDIKNKKYLSFFDLQWRYKGKIIEKFFYILIVYYKWKNWKMQKKSDFFFDIFSEITLKVITAIPE
jgi:hypothetical protein